MAVMTAPTSPSTAETIVAALADAYRRQGYHQVAVPASLLLGLVSDRQELESTLARLLDDGGVVPVGNNGVALHPNARIALLGRGVLEKWLSSIKRESETKAVLYHDGIARELATLVSWGSNAALPDDLTQRAAELAGVLATFELDPRAIDVVATHGGTPRSRLTALASLRPRSLPVTRLRDHLRHTVSSAYPG